MNEAVCSPPRAYSVVEKKRHKCQLRFFGCKLQKTTHLKLSKKKKREIVIKIIGIYLKIQGQAWLPLQLPKGQESKPRALLFHSGGFLCFEFCYKAHLALICLLVEHSLQA